METRTDVNKVSKIIPITENDFLVCYIDFVFCLNEDTYKVEECNEYVNDVGALIKQDKIQLVVTTFNPVFYVLDFRKKEVIFSGALDTFNII